LTTDGSRENSRTERPNDSIGGQDFERWDREQVLDAVTHLVRDVDHLYNLAADARTALLDPSRQGLRELVMQARAVEVELLLSITRSHS